MNNKKKKVKVLEKYLENLKVRDELLVKLKHGIITKEEVADLSNLVEELSQIVADLIKMRMIDIQVTNSKDSH